MLDAFMHTSYKRDDLKTHARSIKNYPLTYNIQILTNKTPKVCCILI